MERDVTSDTLFTFGTIGMTVVHCYKKFIFINNAFPYVSKNSNVIRAATSLIKNTYFKEIISMLKCKEMINAMIRRKKN